MTAEEKRKYRRKWYQENKEKKREYEKKYREKRKAICDENCFECKFRDCIKG